MLEQVAFWPATPPEAVSFSSTPWLVDGAGETGLPLVSRQTGSAAHAGADIAASRASASGETTWLRLRFRIGRFM